MIVDEDHVASALAYLRDDEVVAQVYLTLTRCENEVDRIHSRLYLGSKGTVDERKAQVLINPEHIAASDRLATAISDVKRHQANVNSSQQVISVWQTQNANMRHMERVQ
jgi:hypothetical protein